MSKRAMLNAEG